MKKIQTTFFVIALLLLTIHMVSHLYMRYSYDAPSVLDVYIKDKVDKHIEDAVSLEMLLEKYDIAFKKVEAFEKGKTKEEIEKNKYKYDMEPYKTKRKYGDAIRDWEKKEEEIQEIIVFWFAGLLLILTGALLYYKKITWIGVALILSGFGEMIWWPSPSFTMNGARLEFIKLLNTKILFTFMSYAVLIIVWMINKKKITNDNN